LFWHSLDVWQLWPSCFGPQVPFTQAIPVSQSAFVVQAVVQAAPTQRNGLQSCRPGAWQVPSPLQVPAVLRRLPVQVGATHNVSRG
jgi:hypothetical protein